MSYSRQYYRMSAFIDQMSRLEFVDVVVITFTAIAIFSLSNTYPILSEFKELNMTVKDIDKRFGEIRDDITFIKKKFEPFKEKENKP
jgi:hypothetical protein